jgi:hypothetical protein
MRRVEVSVEKRLLRLADSFAEQVSKEDVDAFRAEVYARLGLPAPSTTASRTGEVDTSRVGPPGGSLREGDESNPTEQVGVTRPKLCTTVGPAGPVSQQ